MGRAFRGLTHGLRGNPHGWCGCYLQQHVRTGGKTAGGRGLRFMRFHIVWTTSCGKVRNNPCRACAPP